MNWLRQKRKSLGKTQLDIAMSVNISGPFYSMIECGRRRPSPDIAKRIASVLGFADEWYRLLDDKKATVFGMLPVKRTVKNIKILWSTDSSVGQFSTIKV